MAARIPETQPPRLVLPVRSILLPGTPSKSASWPRQWAGRANRRKAPRTASEEEWLVPWGQTIPASRSRQIWQRRPDCNNRSDPYDQVRTVDQDLLLRVRYPITHGREYETWPSDV